MLEEEQLMSSLKVSAEQYKTIGSLITDVHNQHISDLHLYVNGKRSDAVSCCISQSGPWMQEFPERRQETA